MSTALPSITTSDNLITCFIAGGAGFIGSHLCEKLLEQNCYVYCVDNFSTGRHENLKAFEAHPRFELIQVDLSEIATLELKRPLDYVFHVAAIEAYLNGLDVDMDTLLINSFGTRSLLQLAHKHHAKFLLGSSEQIYHPFHVGESFEDYFGQGRPDQGTHVFVEAKRFSESLTVEFAKEKGVDARIVRMAFLYGPRMSVESGSLLSKMLVTAVGKQKVVIPNDGMAIWYPTYIDDAVYGLIKAMFSQSSRGKIYGLLNTQPITLLHFAHQIELAMQQSLKIEFHLTDRELSADILPEQVLKSQEALGWYPRHTLETGLKKTIAWLKTHPKLHPTHIPTPSPLVVERIASLEPPPTPVTLPKPGLNSTSQLGIPLKPSVVTTSWQDRLKLLKPFRNKKRSGPSLGMVKHLWAYGVGGSLVLLLGVALWVMPLWMVRQTTQRSMDQIQTARTAALTDHWDQVETPLNEAQSHFERLQQWYPWLAWQGAWSESFLPNTLPLYLEHGDRFLEVLRSLYQAQVGFAAMTDVVLDRSLGDIPTYLQQIAQHLSETQENLKLLEAELSPEDQARLQLDLATLKNGVQGASQLVQIAPDLLALEDRKTILVLLQDDHELRASGGFIEAVAILSLEKGRILDFEVMDVFKLDNLLSGTIKPPEVIEKHLGSNKWLLRDSNVALDFPESAARAAWFVQKQIGKTADGVIALNYDTLERMLAVISELTLEGVDGPVTAKNLRSRALSNSQIKVTPKDGGNSQMFIAKLAQELYHRLTQLPGTQLSSLVPTFHQSLNEKQLMIWLPNTPSQALLQQWGWDGALRQTPNELAGFGTIALSDFLAISELNLGVNKVNANIQRNIDHQVVWNEPELAQITSTITLKNQAQTNSWPDGSYKVYLEVFLPPQATVTTIKTGATQSSLKRVSSRSLTIDNANQKEVRGLFLEIPIRQEQVVEISYELQAAQPTNSALPYVLYLQKQSGTSNTAVSMTLRYPATWVVERLSKAAQVTQGSVQFSDTLNKDQVFAVSFGR